MEQWRKISLFRKMLWDISLEMHFTRIWSCKLLFLYVFQRRKLRRWTPLLEENQIKEYLMWLCPVKPFCSKGLLRKGVAKEYVATPILIAVLEGCPNQYKIERKQRQLYGVLTGSFSALMLDCWIHIPAWEGQSVGHDLENWVYSLKS